ncbi:MAG: hypothetical protein M1818_008474 [Claussenomyces sp. TS43310]|nr:MAG: hypothetical protein M1818_008474 [Claussenomyces sp. TS43310]
MFINSFEIMNINPSMLYSHDAVTICPICQRGNSRSMHSIAEQETHGAVLARLLAWVPEWVFFHGSPELKGVIRKYMPLANCFSSIIYSTPELDSSSQNLDQSTPRSTLSSEPWFLNVADQTAISWAVHVDELRPLPTFQLGMDKDISASSSRRDVEREGLVASEPSSNGKSALSSGDAGMDMQMLSNSSASASSASSTGGGGIWPQAHVNHLGFTSLNEHVLPQDTSSSALGQLGCWHGHHPILNGGWDTAHQQALSSDLMQPPFSADEPSMDPQSFHFPSFQ